MVVVGVMVRVHEDMMVVVMIMMVAVVMMVVVVVEIAVGVHKDGGGYGIANGRWFSVTT